ncbi:MAG: Xaa-Pro peptidase family protein, partial [Deinococcus sp.]|nr:Xaa-Pro peptidase family protein [Deinococcus sp.]
YSNYKLQGNVDYLSGYVTTLGGFHSVGGTETVNFGSAAVVLPLEAEPMLLTDLVWDAIRAAEDSYIPRTYGSTDFAQTIYEFFKEKGINKGKVGIEPWHVFPASIHLKLTELLPGVTFERSRIMERVRMIKSAFELECLREAERITDLGVQAGLKAFVEGATAREVALEAEYVMRKYGDHHLGTPTLLGAGERTASGSPMPTDKKVEKGDLLMIDIGARYNGYCGDISRAKVCGEPTPAQERLFNATLAMNRAVIDAIRPGVLASDLHKLAVRVSREYGYGPENNIHLTGHGVGLDIHERPDYGVEETPLAENMVITVEPCLLEPGVGGIRIEDLVLVTNTGAEVLSKTPRTLV